MNHEKPIRNPWIARWWNTSPAFRDFVRSWKILLKYGRFHPDKLVFPGNRILYVNPKDNRGKLLLAEGGISQPELSRFWREGLALLQPDLVLDVGANYGECTLTASYPGPTHIMMVEANPALITCLEKSIAAHPDGERIHLYQVLASDTNESERSFFVDTNWSGTSSAVPVSDSRHLREQRIPARTVDSMIADLGVQPNKVLFKIDVEGYEAFVLRGMRKLLKTVGTALGFVELDTAYLRLTGTDLGGYFSDLQKDFFIFLVHPEQGYIEWEFPDVARLFEWWGTDTIHTDMLLSTDLEFGRKMAGQTVRLKG